MIVKKIKSANPIAEIVRNMRVCNVGELYDIYEHGVEKGIMRCIQETKYLVIFENPDEKYSWKRYVADKRDIAANKVRIMGI